MIRWFNETIEGVPVTLQILIGGLIVMPVFLGVVIWLPLSIIIGVGHVVGLR